jgi:hypothetical protein
MKTFRVVAAATLVAALASLNVAVAAEDKKMDMPMTDKPMTDKAMPEKAMDKPMDKKMDKSMEKPMDKSMDMKTDKPMAHKPMMDQKAK